MLANQPGLTSEFLASDWPVASGETLCKKKKEQGEGGVKEKEGEEEEEKKSDQFLRSST